MPYIENSNNPIVDLSYNFGVRIVKVLQISNKQTSICLVKTDFAMWHKYRCKRTREYTRPKQG